MADRVGMVLCAGLGTRLRPLTGSIPKPAAPVCGVPLVGWSFALLRGAGVSRVVINTHHLPDAMEAAARRAAEPLGIALSVAHEPVIAGTGGALREARDRLDGASEIVVLNGDVLFDVDLEAAVAAHRRSGALATMVLVPMPPGARYNAVETDRGGAVRRIAGRSGPGGEGLTPWHFTGVHVLAPELLARVPAAPFESDVNHGVYPALMAEGAVRGWFTDGYWNDLGTPARCLEATLDVLAGRVPLGRFAAADPFAGVARRGREAVWVAASARVAPGASLHAPCMVRAGAAVEAGAAVGPGAVVGEGSVVGAGAVLRRAAVWEGTRIAPGETVEDAIAAGALRVAARG